MRAAGHVVLLEAPIDELTRRLLAPGQRATRPLLTRVRTRSCARASKRNYRIVGPLMGRQTWLWIPADHRKMRCTACYRRSARCTHDGSWPPCTTEAPATAEARRACARGEPQLPGVDRPRCDRPPRRRAAAATRTHRRRRCPRHRLDGCAAARRGGPGQPRGPGLLGRADRHPRRRGPQDHGHAARGARGDDRQRHGTARCSRGPRRRRRRRSLRPRGGDVHARRAGGPVPDDAPRAGRRVGRRQGRGRCPRRQEHGRGVSLPDLRPHRPRGPQHPHQP
jgi:hypothetical protein